MEQTSPAVLGPVEPTVRPRAWAKPTTGGDYLRSTPAMEDTPEAVDGLTRYGWQPLFDRPTPEAVAWALAEEAGEDPGTLIWEGNPPEPWGEVWCRYMPQAERLVKRLFGA